MIGETVGRYEIIDHLGHGGMAEVYKAYHPGLDRYVAVKVMHTFLAREKDFLERFQREAKAVAALRHPNIVQVFDFDFDQQKNFYYMVMEFLDGQSLKTHLEEMAERGERMSLDEAVRIVTSIGAALSYAHRRGMVHRDVKPANVMFNSDGQAILTDFGIAKMVNVSGLTASGAMVGTPAYIAPEQGLGKAGDERADIYSLGVMLYQMVIGALPFDADTPMGIVMKHISEPLPSPRAIRPDLPPGVERVIVRSLAKDPDQRYQTVADFVADLQQMSSGAVPSDTVVMSGGVEKTMVGGAATPPPGYVTPPPIYVTPPPAYVTPPPPAQGGATAVLRESAPKRRPWLWIAIGGGLVALLVFVGVAWALLRGLGVFDGGVAEVTSQPPTSAPDTSATELAATMAALQATVGAPTATPTATSTPLPTPTSTPEPDLTATAYAACEFSVEVLEDPAVWPPILAPDQDFAKSWEVRNTGTCPWENGFQLAFVSGSQLGGPLAIPVDPTAANETWGVTLSLTAPSENGTYTGMWQLQTADGAAVGEPLAVSIVVGPTATPRPPTATPTPLASPTPPPALEMSWPSIISCWVDNDAGRWGGQIVWNAWGGPSTEYHYFYGGVASEQELATAGDSFSVQINSPLRVTYFTTSGVGVFWPLPEGCCGGSEGRWTSPEGYQVVWKAVQYDISRCP